MTPHNPDARLIALDVDGTLMTFDEFMSDEVRDVVARLREAEHHVVLATGRPLVATLPVARELNIETGWIVCSNGSVTAQLDPQLPGGYQIEHSVLFDPRSALEVLDRFMPGVQFALEEVGVGYWVNERFPHDALHGERTVMSFEELSSRRTARLVVSDAPVATSEFHAAVAELGLVAEQFAIAHTQWMDLAPKGITKAYALERLRERFGVPLDLTLAVGDGNNDIDMLKWAGHGVAMGHAEASVIAAADDVTHSILEDGVVPVLESALLERTLY